MADLNPAEKARARAAKLGYELEKRPGGWSLMKGGERVQVRPEDPYRGAATSGTESCNKLREPLGEGQLARLDRMIVKYFYWVST